MSERRRRPLAALAAAVALGTAAPPGPGAEPLPSVRPGTIVRWPGQGIEWCELGARRFEPLAGACYFPVDLLRRAGPLELTRGRGGKRETAAVRVGKFDYPIQKLALPRHMVELSPEDLARVNRENREMARLWTREGPRLFSLPLGKPLCPLPAGGRFGHRRIINGLPRSPHGGADYSVAEGTPVVAAADGTVAMVADQFFGGNAVFVDHGDGLVTMYMHMSRVDVAEGASVRRGDRVGAVGSTGRATGPHLHFGARWRGARVDPALLLGEPGAILTIEQDPPAAEVRLRERLGLVGCDANEPEGWPVLEMTARGVDIDPFVDASPSPSPWASTWPATRSGLPLRR